LKRGRAGLGVRRQRLDRSPRRRDPWLQLGVGVLPEIDQLAVVVDRLRCIAALLVQVAQALVSRRFIPGVQEGAVQIRRLKVVRVDSDGRIGLAGSVVGAPQVG
jgi:hypothetical protein